jgi:hypothetical protein
MPRTWRVVFRGPVSDDDLAGLPADRMLWVTGHEVRGLRSSTIWVRADDADSAERTVRDAVAVTGEVEPAEALLYSVSVEVPPEDVALLVRALSARRRETGSIGPLLSPASEDEPAELLLDVDAQTDDEAITLAGEQYRAARDEAGLPESDPVFRMLYPPWPGEQRPAQPRPQALLQRARDLLAQGVHDGAVVIAQSAVEVLVAREIGQRLQREEIGHLRPYILNGIRQHNLNDDPTRTLWQVLSGDQINQTEPWREYKRHLNRRNDIVHRGISVTDDDAAASVAVVDAMIQHIESLPLRRD